LEYEIKWDPYKIAQKYFLKTFYFLQTPKIWTFVLSKKFSSPGLLQIYWRLCEYSIFLNRSIVGEIHNGPEYGVSSLSLTYDVLQRQQMMRLTRWSEDENSESYGDKLSRHCD